MIIPCEVMSRSVVPAIKAIMAEQLMEKHGLNQNQVAELLGISQSAVSKYARKVRGHAIEISGLNEIQTNLNDMILSLVNGSKRREDFLKTFCDTCMMIRAKCLVCNFCQETDPRIKTDECTFCTGDIPRQKEK